MIRHAIIFLLVSYRVFLCAQEITYSRNFETLKKNVPFAMINNHPDHFYLLRYNKIAHDFSIERRSKADARILAFTPLKLDSVNAAWFDYQNLEYLFFEHEDKLYFVFEKQTNSERRIYFKTIDNKGKASGFAEIFSIEKDRKTIDMHLTFRRMTGAEVLIVSEKQDYNYNTSKTVCLYNLSLRKQKFIKKLPIENPALGYSAKHVTNTRGDLFYLMVKSRIAGYTQVYKRQRFEVQPVFVYDSLSLNAILNDSVNTSARKSVFYSGFTALHNSQIVTSDLGAIVSLHFSLPGDDEVERVYFHNLHWDPVSDTTLFENLTPLNEEMNRQLTFYDGTDNNSAASKLYAGSALFQGEYDIHQLAERTEEGSFKELIYSRTDKSKGRVEVQKVIPRKLFYFKYQTHYKSVHAVSSFVCGRDFYSVLLEHSDNANADPMFFKYHKFAKLNGPQAGNIVVYKINREGNSLKKTLVKSAGYESIPLEYQSNQCDFIIYQVRGIVERFGFVRSFEF